MQSKHGDFDQQRGKTARFSGFFLTTVAILFVWGTTGRAGGFEPPGWPIVTDLSIVPVTTVLPIDVPSLVSTGQMAADIPLEFAIARQCNASLGRDGSQSSTPDGGTLWAMQFHAPGATDLSLTFSRFELPPDSTAWLCTDDYHVCRGPFDQSDSPTGRFWSPLLPGNRAVLEVITRLQSEAPVIEVAAVNAGFLDVFSRAEKTLGMPADCNIDVVCPEAAPWADPVHSVGLYSLNGTTLCSGVMAMDASGSFKPLFLTAAHCGATEANAESMVVYWNMDSPVCGDHSGGTFDQYQLGATLLATRSDVDIALLELDDQPNLEWGVYWAGWDRTATIPAGSTACIHQPNGGEKAIAINTDPITIGDSCSETGGVGTHWIVDDWENGTTEPGSTGGGLWDDSNPPRLIGILSGGEADCDNLAGSDCFGRLDAAWSGGSGPGERLAAWLDPDNTGAVAVDGGYSPPTLTIDSITGTDTCPHDSGLENGVWDPGETIQVAVTAGTSAALTNVTGTLTSATPGIAIVDGTADWPDLTVGVPATSLDPHFTIALAGSLPCGTIIDLELRLTGDSATTLPASLNQTLGAVLEPSVPVPIPDDSAVQSTLVVGTDEVLTDVNVSVTLTHSYVGDLSLTLESPTGTQVSLLDRPGVPATSFGCGNDDMNLTFDDSAGVNPENECAGTTPWLSGDVLPVDPLSAFVSESSLGTWTLSVTDAASGDTGVLVDWSLETVPRVKPACPICALFADGFESGNTSAWSAQEPMVQLAIHENTK